MKELVFMPNVMGCPDKPVSKISDDLFEVSRYVDGLCSFVSSCDTPMTISIQGDWGSGKTSMMNMMKEKLEKNNVPHMVQHMAVFPVQYG